MSEGAVQKFAYAFANCSDRTRIDALNHWYSTMHVPDIISTDGFVRGTRYQLAAPPSEGQREFIALYELQTDDSYRDLNERHRADLARYREEAPDRIAVPEGATVVDAGFIEQASAQPLWSPPGAGSDQPPRTLLFELYVCDAGRLDAAERWFNDVHLPAAGRLEGVSRTSMYRWPRPRDGRMQFCAFYALDAAPAQAGNYEATLEGERGNAPDGVEFVTSGAYRYLSDMVKTWSRWDDMRAWKSGTA